MVKITDYRGFQIFFDQHEEHFYANSERYDNESTKKSFASVKSYIDEYIKKNQTFIPFVVQNKSGEIRRIIGIRKDLKFNYDDGKGGVSQFSDYDRKNFFKYEESNDTILKNIKDLEQKGRDLYAEARRLEETLTKNKVDWDAIKDQYRIA